MEADTTGRCIVYLSLHLHDKWHRSLRPGRLHWASIMSSQTKPWRARRVLLPNATTSRPDRTGALGAMFGCGEVAERFNAAVLKSLNAASARNRNPFLNTTPRQIVARKYQRLLIP